MQSGFDPPLYGCEANLTQPVRNRHRNRIVKCICRNIIILIKKIYDDRLLPWIDQPVLFNTCISILIQLQKSILFLEDGEITSATNSGAPNIRRDSLVSSGSQHTMTSGSTIVFKSLSSLTSIGATYG